MESTLSGMTVIMNLAGGLLFYGGLILLVVMIRKVGKDIEDIKRSINNLESTLMAMPRAGSPQGPEDRL